MNSRHQQREYDQAPDTLYRTQKSDMLNMTFQNVVISDVICNTKENFFFQYVHISSLVILSCGVNMLTFIRLLFDQATREAAHQWP